MAGGSELKMRSRRRADHRASHSEPIIRSVGVFEMDGDRDKVHWSEELERIFGYSPGAFDPTFEAWERLVLPIDLRRVKRQAAEAVREQKPSFSYHYRIHRKSDGAVRNIEAAVLLRYDEVGALKQAIGANIDVTDWRGEEARWRSLFEQMHEGFMLCELIRNEKAIAVDIRFIEVNDTWARQWQKLTGRPVKIALGKTASELINPLENFWINKFASVVELGKPQNFIGHSAALHRWYQVHAYPYDGDRFAAVFLDVTEQKRLEAEAERVKQQNLRSSRLSAMGAMASTLAHELNQPLGAAANYIEAARLTAFNTLAPAANELIEAAKGELMKAADIISKMRDFALTGQVDRSRVSIDNIVAAATAETVAALGCHDVIITLDLDKEVGEILGSPVQLQQVFANLMRNAATAMDGQALKQLIVRARRSNDFAVITFTDNGPGIAPDRVAHVFDAFESNSIGGLGLGLALCRTIIEAHGGSMTVASSNTGTTFSIFMPTKGH